MNRVTDALAATRTVNMFIKLAQDGMPLALVVFLVIKCITYHLQLALVVSCYIYYIIYITTITYCMYAYIPQGEALQSAPTEVATFVLLAIR